MVQFCQVFHYFECFDSLNSFVCQTKALILGKDNMDMDKGKTGELYMSKSTAVEGHLLQLAITIDGLLSKTHFV